jgi:uncharacterized membrane protein
MQDLSWPKRILLLLASLLFVASGILHFAKPAVYLKIMPPYIPSHLAMVHISGICECLGGLGLLLPATRRAAAWALVALMIAVFPANIYMATNPVETGASAIPAAIRWGRLPLQLVFVLWLLWSAKPSSSKAPQAR